MKFIHIQITIQTFEIHIDTVIQIQLYGYNDMKYGLGVGGLESSRLNKYIKLKIEPFIAEIVFNMI